VVFIGLRFADERKKDFSAAKKSWSKPAEPGSGPRAEQPNGPSVSGLTGFEASDEGKKK
jgi:hypothetical protein